MAEEYKKQEERTEETRTPEQIAELIEAGRATRTGETDKPDMPVVPGGTEKPETLESNADKTFQENMEGQKYAHTNDLIGRLEKERDELADNRTPEQKKKDARREKMAKIFAALGDGVAAMSNLVLASKGAIPYQSKSMISKAVGDRYAQFRKDLEDRKAKSLALSERIAQLRQGVEDRKAEDERLKAAQALANAKFEAEQNDRDRYYKLALKKFSHTQGIDNKKLGLEERGLEHKIENDNATRAIAQQNANANTTNARANATRAATDRANGGRGTRYEFQGKTYGNKDAWGAAIKREATRLGISLSEKYKTTDQLGNERTYERHKPIDQLLAEVNEKLAAQGGSGGGAGPLGGFSWK